MFDAAIACLAISAAVTVLAVLGLLADEWGSDTRDGFTDPLHRTNCH